MSPTSIFLVITLAFVAVDSRLLIDWQTLRPVVSNGRNFTTDYTSVPVKYRNNEYRFPNVSGTLIAYECGHSCNFTDKVVMIRFRGYQRPYLEQILTEMQEAQVRAVVIAGESFEKNENVTDLGSVLSFNTGSGFSTDVVLYPIININWTSWRDMISSNFTNQSRVEVTLTSEGDNVWYDIRHGAWFPVQQALLLAFEAVDIGLALYALTLLPRRFKHIANFCLYLEIVSLVIRMMYAIDPWRGDFLPAQVTHVFLTASFPITIAVSFLLLFWWQELVTKSSLEVSSFLTKNKWIATIVITILFLLEIITASMRAYGAVDGAAFIYVNRVLYLVVLLFLFIYYIYVVVVVGLFLNRLSRMRSGQKILKRVTIRAAIATLGYFMYLFGGPLTLTDFYSQAVGESAINFLFHTATNICSLAHILAFMPASKSAVATSKSRATQSESAMSSPSLHVSASND